MTSLKPLEAGAAVTPISQKGTLRLREKKLLKGGMFLENSIETCILSRVKQITSPGWMHETSARTWCTGKT